MHTCRHYGRTATVFVSERLTIASVSLDWRHLAQILLNIEHRLMSQAAAPCEYDSLSIMQKVEVFEMALSYTAGQDLYKVNR